MNKKRRERYIDYAVLTYTMVFILYSFVGRIIPLYTAIPSNINNIIFIVFAVWGVILILLDIFSVKNLLKSSYCWILYCFVFIMAVSSLVNIKYGLVDNVKTIVWTIIQIAIFYSVYTRFKKEQMMNFIHVMFHIISWIWTIAILYALKQFVVMESYGVEIWKGEWKYQGFRENRLFGIFNDPNYAAVTSIYVVFMLCLIAKKTKKKWLRAICLISCICHGAYVVLSGSRTAKICAIVSVIVFVFLILKNRFLEKKYYISVISRFLTAALAAIIVIVSGLLAKEVLPNLPKAYAAHWVANQSNNDSDEEDVLRTESAEKIQNLDKNYFLQRQDVKESQSSNTRQRIWNNYIKGVEGRYFIGASPRNVEKYMKDEHPRIYALNNGYETHNGYLSVFVGTGIVGLSIIIMFMILKGIRLFKYSFGEKEIDSDFVFLVTIIFIILVYTFFFTELFFVNNLTTSIFWCLLGCLAYWTD